MVYDDNRISIEGSTELAASEDVAARYAAYGWHVKHVDLSASGDIAIPALSRALEEATAETTRPSIILMRSIISWPVPGAQNSPKAHGSALGTEAVRAAKIVLGADPDATFRRAGGGLRANHLGGARSRVLRSRRLERDFQYVGEQQP
jgi:transketolase